MKDKKINKEGKGPGRKTAWGRLFDSLRQGTFSEILDDWRWIFSYSARYKGAIAFYTVIGVLSTTLGLVTSVASKYLIDIITGYQTDKLGLMAVIVLSSSVTALVFSNLVKRISAKLSVRISNDIQADIYDKIMDARWSDITRYRNGDILNRFNSDVGTVSGNAISWMPSVVIAVYRFTATFFVIWHYDRIMALLSFLSAPVMLLMSRFLISRQRLYSRRVREVSSEMMTFETESLYNMDTIKSFGIMDLFGEKLRAIQERYKNLSLEYNLFSIKVGVFSSVLKMLVQYIAFGYCLYRLWTHKITYGTMTLFLEQRASLSTAFSNVAGILPGFLNSSVSAHRIRELVQLPREVHKEDHSAVDAMLSEGKLSVCMENVCYAYTEGTHVIKNSYLHASPGEIVALVGPSGEGKTTLIRLILGLVQPESGRVFLRGESGLETDMNADSRLLFTYVPQGNTIMSGSIADNMRIVNPKASDEEIIRALKISCAWEFVRKLPSTIESELGERGRGLSEGQAQRVAIARALLRDAPVLLLDEATSALDARTEGQVLKNIREFCPDKTCIVTTHHAGVLDQCTRIYRVQQLQVTELTREEGARIIMDC